MILELEVLWHTDETRPLEEAGIDFDPSKLENRTMTFYHIDAISENRWDKDHYFTNIYAGGEKWISPFEYEYVKDLIEKAMPES